MHTEKTLFELQSQVESVQNATQAIKDLKVLADSSLKAFNNSPQKFFGVDIDVNGHLIHLVKVSGSVVFEQWIASHFIPALQHLCEMSVSEVHGLKGALHHLTRPETDSPGSFSNPLTGSTDLPQGT